MLKEMDDREAKREKILNNYRETARRPGYSSQRGEREDEERACGGVESEGAGVARNEQKNCFKRKKMCRETAEAQALLPLRISASSLSLSPFLFLSFSLTRSKLSVVLFPRKGELPGEGNTNAGSSLLVIFSTLSLTHRNPSTTIHLPPCLTGLLSKYRSAAPDDASTLDHSSSSSLMRITSQPYTRAFSE